MEEVAEKSRVICDKIISGDMFKNSEVVMAYISFGNEVRTMDIIKAALSAGKKVLVPVTSGERMEPCVLNNPYDLKKGAFGIEEPAEKHRWNGKVDLCIIPGVGFDKAGGRIGFGKGYYDKFLVETPCKKIGIAYENQIVDNAFSEAHDIPMDIIITEGEVFCCE